MLGVVCGGEEIILEAWCLKAEEKPKPTLTTKGGAPSV
jgi:hypothetical protein